jgi:hypothetical protein
MAVYNGELYVGGYFHQLTGEAGDNIMKWNGNSWSDLGPGNDIDTAHQIDALIVYHGELYAAGIGDGGAGGVPNTQRIAKWDGTQWHSLGTFIGTSTTNPRYILTMTIFNDELYIGGKFDTLDLTVVNNIAKYNNATGIFESVKNNFDINIYPNPATETFSVEIFSQSAQQKHFTLYNTLAQKLLQENFTTQKHTVNISSFPNGIYFIEIKTEKETFRKKIIKQ